MGYIYIFIYLLADDVNHDANLYDPARLWNLNCEHIKRVIPSSNGALTNQKPKKYHIIPHPIIKFEQLFCTQTLVFSRTCLRIRASQERQTWLQLMCGFADESHFWHRAWQSSPVHHTWGRSGIPILDGESKPSSFFRVG